MTSRNDPAAVARRHRRMVRAVPLAAVPALALLAAGLGTGHRGALALAAAALGALALGMWLARPARTCPRCGSRDRGVHLSVTWDDGVTERHLCERCLGRGR